MTKKTEEQHRKEYEARQIRLEVSFEKHVKKARERQRKASNQVNKLERDYLTTQSANRRKYFHSKKVRRIKGRKK